MKQDISIVLRQIGFTHPIFYFMGLEASVTIHPFVLVVDAQQKTREFRRTTLQALKVMMHHISVEIIKIHGVGGITDTNDRDILSDSGCIRKVHATQDCTENNPRKITDSQHYD